MRAPGGSWGLTGRKFEGVPDAFAGALQDLPRALAAADVGDLGGEIVEADLEPVAERAGEAAPDLPPRVRASQGRPSHRAAEHPVITVS